MAGKSQNLETLKLAFKIDDKELKGVIRVFSQLIDGSDNLEKVFSKVSNNFNKSSKSNKEFIKQSLKGNNSLYKSQDMLNESMEEYVGSTEKATRAKKDLIDQFRSALPQIGAFYYGIVNIVRESHTLNQETKEWYKELNQLTDATGSANLAIAQMHTVFGMSAGSLGTVRSAMVSLVGQGIPNTTQGFEHLTAWVVNLSQATGIGAESFSNFAGIMVRNWGMSIGATERMTSSVLALQNTFKLTAAETDIAMKTIGESMEQVGPYLKNGAEGAKALTKSVGSAIGVMSKFGVSTQKAAEFMSKLVDPEKIGENLGLLNRLGISYQDYMEMLSSGDAQQGIFDKMMKNLPQVSQQIQNIADPLARMNFAKSLGIPMEIASKMAKATTGEIQNLMKDYKKQAEEDKAAQKRQQQMQAEAGKFDDTLHLLKRDALQPMMKWVNENIGIFWKAMKTFYGYYKQYVSTLTKVFDRVRDIFVPLFDVLEGKKTFGDFMGEAAIGILDLVGDAIIGGWNIIYNNFWNVVDKLKDTFTTFYGKLNEAYPVLTKFITGLALFKGAQIIKNFVKGFIGGERGSSPMNPMYVSNTSGNVGDIGKNLFGKIGAIKDKALSIGSKASSMVTSLPGKVAGGAGSAIGSIGGLFTRNMFADMQVGGFGKTAAATSLRGTIASGASKGIGAIGGLASKGLMGLAKGAGVAMKAFGPIGFAISGLLGAFDGVANASKYFATETISMSEKFASGFAGALNGITLGFMSEETQKAIAQGIGGLFSSKEGVAKEIGDFGSLIAKNGKLTDQQLERLGYLLKQSGDEIQDANVWTQDAIIKQKIARDQELTERDKLIQGLIGQGKEVEASQVIRNLSFAEIEKERIKKAREQEAADISGAEAGIVQIPTFKYSDDEVTRSMWGLDKDKKALDINVDTIGDETRQKILDEADGIMRMMGYGLTKQQQAIVDKYKMELQQSEAEEIQISEQRKRQLKEKIALGEQINNKAINAEKIQMLLAMSQRLMTLKEGSKEYLETLKKYNSLNKEFGDLSKSHIEALGLTNEGLLAEIENLITDLNTLSGRGGLWDDKAFDDVEAKFDLMKQKSSLALTSKSGEYIAAIEAAKQQLEIYKSGLDAEELAKDKPIIENLQKQLDVKAKQVSMRKEAMDKIDAKQKETTNRLLIKNNQMTGAGASHLKAIKEQGDKKKPERADWLSSVLGMKGVLKIKSSMS